MKSEKKPTFTAQPAVFPRSGWVLRFPGIPAIWFAPDRAHTAVEVLQRMVADFRSIRGRSPFGARLEFRHGSEEPVSAASIEAPSEAQAA